MDEIQNDVQEGGEVSDIAPEESSAEGQEDQEVVETQEPQENSEPRASKRIRQLNEKYKQAEARAIEVERKLQALSGAQSLHEKLSKNPTAWSKVLALLEEKQEPAQEEQGLSLDGYDPEDPVIKTLKKVYQDNQELKKEIADFKSFKDNQVRTSVEQHQSDIDEYFDSMLIKDGYLDEGKEATPVADTMQKLVLAELASSAQDPMRPTRAEVAEAYKNAKEGLGHFEKFKLTKQVKQTQVPPTGSRKGVAPGKVATSKMTDEERQSLLANMFS